MFTVADTTVVELRVEGFMPETVTDDTAPVVLLSGIDIAVLLLKFTFCVVVPVPVAEEVKLTEAPAQMEVELAFTVTGMVATVTVTGADVVAQEDVLLTVQLYVPEAETVIDCVVAPLDHK